MLGVMRDPGAKESRRDEMARCAAGFCHLRLSSAVVGLSDSRLNIPRRTSTTLAHERIDRPLIALNEAIAPYLLGKL
jgi:hypothetical protein